MDEQKGFEPHTDAEEQGSVIELTDENGKQVSFDLLMTFDYEGKRYAAVMPLDEVEGVGEDEVILFEVVKGAKDVSYLPIENPILLDEVFDEFMELFDDMLDEEDEKDEKD